MAILISLVAQLEKQINADERLVHSKEVELAYHLLKDSLCNLVLAIRAAESKAGSVWNH
jgi:hypothetical protein